jgi:hypothetical protein
VSALSVDAVIDQLQENLRTELARLNPDASPMFIAEVIGGWLSNAIIAAEMEKLIDSESHLTALGREVVQRLRDTSTKPRQSAQQVLRSGQLGIVIQATLLLINPDDASYIIHLIGLSDTERMLLDEIGVTDEGGNLTKLGIELVRDLKWIRA